MKKTGLLMIFAIFALLQFSAVAEEVSDEVRSIQQMIQEQGLGWTAGQTSMMDLTVEERQMRRGLLQPTEEMQRIYDEIDQLPPPLLTNTESVFDWRLLGGVTPVTNQGNCGSCWAFAAIAGFESAYLIKEGIVELFDSFVAACKPGGMLILSGILANQVEELNAFFAGKGFVDCEITTLNEWVCYVIKV